MKALRTLALAIIVYAVLILTFGKLLVVGKPHLPFVVGTMLDSLLTIGIAFNFIVLLLVTTKLLAPVRAVRAASISVVLLVATFLLLIPAQARPGGIAMTALVLSMLIWFGIHRWWAHKQTERALS